MTISRYQEVTEEPRVIGRGAHGPMLTITMACDSISSGHSKRTRQVVPRTCSGLANKTTDHRANGGAACPMQLACGLDFGAAELAGPHLPP